MSVEKIVEKILSDARAEAEHLRAQTERMAEKIRAEAQDMAARLREQILAAAREQAERQRRMHLATAHLAARQQVLAARHAALERVFSEVAQRLESLDATQYRELLRRWLLESAETGAEALIVSSRDRALFSSDLLEGVNAELKKRGRAGALRLVGQTDELERGFVLKGDGYEVRVTPKGWLARLREDLEGDVMKLLEGRLPP